MFLIAGDSWIVFKELSKQRERSRAAIIIGDNKMLICEEFYVCKRGWLLEICMHMHTKKSVALACLGLCHLEIQMEVVFLRYRTKFVCSGLVIKK